jgi:acetoacetate decarboxylase
MPKLRYVRDIEQIKRAQEKNPEFSMKNTVRSLRALYRTDPGIAKAVLPKPLKSREPEVFVQFAHVTMHIPEADPISIGAATVGVACEYQGVNGYYVLAMPMEGEFVVIGGREIYGEPKKLAQIDFEKKGDVIKASATRHNIPFLQAGGVIGEESGEPLEFTEHFYCYKALPSIRKNGGFDGEVFLTRLNWQRNYTRRCRVDGEIQLTESPYDPLVDVPVRELLSMEYVEGSTRTDGEILESVPGEWLIPYIHQRYDDVEVAGIEVSVD